MCIVLDIWCRFFFAILAFGAGSFLPYVNWDRVFFGQNFSFIFILKEIIVKTIIPIKGLVKGTGQVGGIIGRSEYTFVVTNCYNKGNVEGSTNVGAVIGEQLNGNNNLSNLYYLNTIPVKAINNQDYETQNIKGISEDYNSYQEFINSLT